MNSVDCPICLKKIYSETFQPGERFSCPNCKHELTVESDPNRIAVKSSYDLVDHMGWAQGVLKGNRLMITEDKLISLGQFVIGALEMEKWSKESLADLGARATKTQRIRTILAEHHFRDEFYALESSLLDIFINLKKEERES